MHAMQILAINLSQSLIDAISCELGEIVCHTNDVTEACELIKNEDFSIIIRSIDLETVNQSALSTLLGLTSPSTRIVLVSETSMLNEIKKWEELGIEVLIRPTTDDLLRCLKH